MKQWLDEDWNFTITVLSVGKNNWAEDCRVGLEPGDTFECQYACPAGFCPTALMQIFPIMEVIRCGGDLRILGSDSATETKVPCPDGAVWFKITGKHRKS